MNEEKPKSFWKKTIKGRMALVIWLAIAAFAIMLGCFGQALLNYSRPMSDWFFGVGIIVGCCLVGGLILIYLVWPLLRFFFWKHWRRTLFGLACFVTLIALGYAEENWRGKHDWEKFKREWEAQGEKFDYASIAPPPVPDAQNFAMQPIWVDTIKVEFGTNTAKQWYGETMTEAERTNLVDRLNLSIQADEKLAEPPKTGSWSKGTETDLKSWQEYYRKLAAKTNAFHVPSPPQSPAADVLFALSQYDSTVEALRAASQLPYSRFPVFSNADQPFDTLLPHLAIFKRCALFLQLRALAELQNGQSDKALADVKLAVELTEKIRNEPFLISHLVRVAMLQIALQPIYEGLAHHQWSDAQLAALDAELAKLDFLADFEFTIRGERICSISALDYMRRSRTILVFNGNGMDKIKVSLLPSAFFYQNELTMARLYQQYSVPMVDLKKETVSPAQVRRLQTAARQDMFHHWWPYKFFARMLYPAVENSVKKFAYAQSSTDMARVALALERYRLAHGEFPESLDALAPKFISEMPHDVINGEPLKYRRDSNGQFVLYSVGWNERDDGGVVVLKKGSTPTVDTDEGDWVWKYPSGN
jgi:hypothetical protein